MVTERRLLLAAVGAWIAVAVLGLVLGPPLGHDESAFAVSARGDGPPWLYRSTGVTAIARIGIALGGADWHLRLVNAVLGIGLVLAIYAVGRAAFSARTGAWAAAVIAGAHPIVLRNAQLLGDLPAAACVLLGLAVMVGELSRDDGPRWRLVAVGPAFAAAFYFRYGSAPVIAIAGGAAVLLWWRPLLRRPLPAIAAAVVFALLLLPHVLRSLEATGRPLGILSVSAGMPRRAYVGEGLVTYLTSNPFQFYGALVAPVMIAALVGLVKLPARWRPSVFLGLVALGQIILIGVQSHAQPRYIYVAITLLVVLGVEALQRLTPVKLRRAALPLVVLSWVSIVIAAPLQHRSVTEARSSLVVAARAIRADAAGRPCVFVAKVVTQLMWYSGCADQRAEPLDQLPPWPTDRLVYVVSVPRATISLEAVLQHRPGLFDPLPLVDDRARVWRLRSAR